MLPNSFTSLTLERERGREGERERKRGREGEREREREKERDREGERGREREREGERERERVFRTSTPQYRGTHITCHLADAFIQSD